MDPRDGEIPKPIIEGPARQTLRSLMTRLGVEHRVWDPPPVLIFVNVMGDWRECWKKWEPRGSEPKQHMTEYQLIERSRIVKPGGTSGSP